MSVRVRRETAPTEKASGAGSSEGSRATSPPPALLQQIPHNSPSSVLHTNDATLERPHSNTPDLTNPHNITAYPNQPPLNPSLLRIQSFADRFYSDPPWPEPTPSLLPPVPSDIYDLQPYLETAHLPTPHILTIQPKLPPTPSHSDLTAPPRPDYLIRPEIASPATYAAQFEPD